MKGRMLRSKAMMSLSRLPFSSLLDFGRIGLVTMTILFFIFFNA